MGNRSSIETVGNAITGQNVGSGACVFKGKSTGTNLQFKTILSTGSSIQIIETADQIYISGKTDTGGGGEVTGATNGLNINSGKQVGLGGTLTGDTCITGAYTLSLCSGALLNTQSGYQISGITMFRSPASISSVFIGCEAGKLVTAASNSNFIERILNNWSKKTTFGFRKGNRRHRVLS